MNTCPGTIGLFTTCFPTSSPHEALPGTPLADLQDAWFVVLVFIVTVAVIALAVLVASQR